MKNNILKNELIKANIEIIIAIFITNLICILSKDNFENLVIAETIMIPFYNAMIFIIYLIMRGKYE